MGVRSNSVNVAKPRGVARSRVRRSRGEVLSERDKVRPSIAKTTEGLTVRTDSITSELPVICPQSLLSAKITSHKPTSRY